MDHTQSICFACIQESANKLFGEAAPQNNESLFHTKKHQHFKQLNIESVPQKWYKRTNCTCFQREMALKELEADEPFVKQQRTVVK